VFFKLIKVHLLVSELYIYQTARCNDKNFLINLRKTLITNVIKIYPMGAGLLHAVRPKGEK